MSRITTLTKNLTDFYSKDSYPTQQNYHYKKIPNIHKFTGLSSINSSSLNKNITQKISEKNYAHNIFNEKETKQNININTSTIINPFPEKNPPKNQNYITINDIIGEKCVLNLDILNLYFNNYDQSKTSKKSMSLIKSYGVNTYQGLVRNYNEDRVSIIINMNKPKSYQKKKKWPKISFFGIYDGHGGEGCSEFLRDNLHKFICENDYFPDDITQAIKYGISKAEYEFLNNHALLYENNSEIIKDKSGSCVLILLIVDNYIYIANVGDSRCLLSMNNGSKYIEVTKDHKPNSENEILRIKKFGGNIYQSQTVINNLENNFLNGKILLGPYRVIPGRLSVCRTIGDIEAKFEKLGGNKNVIISTPDIYFYDLKKNDFDFFVLGCDGIYDQMSNKEILDLAWMIINNKNNNNNENNENNDIHYKSGLIVDLIIKSSLARKSFDNVTCVFISLKDFNNKENKTKNIDINNNNNFSNNISNDKIYTIKKKSNILNKKIINNNKSSLLNSVDNKCKTNRNDKRKDIYNINNNNNRVNKIFNTESKLNTMNINSLNNLNAYNSFSLRNKIRDISSDLINYNNNITNDDNNNTNNILTHFKNRTNIVTYSKKNQSFNKYFMNKKNNNINNINNNIYNTNTYSSKKISQQNLNIHNKINKPLKLIEPKNTFNTRVNKTNYQNQNQNQHQNKSSIILNNMKNNNKKKFLSNNINNFDNFDNDKKINTTQSDINQNEKLKKILYSINPIKNKYKYKYEKTNVINNTTLKKPKKYLSLNNNNTHNNNINNSEIYMPTNLMINRYLNNAFTTKMKREITSKLRQLSWKKSEKNSYNNTNGGLNVNISNQNISMQNMQNDKYYIYNYANKNNKMKNYNNLSNNSKSYRNNNFNNNNNYLNSDLDKIKQFFFEDSKKVIY